MSVKPEHWEPPEPRMLFVSARRVAAELGVAEWEAQVICQSLEQIFYGESKTHYRVSRRSLDAFERLVESGLTRYLARHVMGWYVKHDMLPPDEVSLDRAHAIARRWFDWNRPPGDGERMWTTARQVRDSQYRGVSKGPLNPPFGGLTPRATARQRRKARGL